MWYGREYGRTRHPGGGVEGYVGLPGNRFAAFDGAGVWLLDAESLRPLAFTFHANKSAIKAMHRA